MKGTKEKSSIILKDEQGRLQIDQNLIANLFNNYFGSIVGLNHPFDPVNMKYLGKVPLNSFFIPEVQCEMVKSLIDALSANKSMGHDMIPPRVWKNISHSCCEVITFIINKCFRNGTYPTECKIAKISPILKGGDKLNVQNYRGISVLPAINKIFERILHENLQNFLYKNELTDQFQFGFTKNKGTHSAVSKLLSIISSRLDNKEPVIVIYFDIKKAFDLIDHKVLLFKLNKMGVRGMPLELISDYLKYRKQFVQIGECRSPDSDIFCGVPQGSVLGPLLFNCLVYDMSCLKTNSTLIKYADDLALVHSANNVEMLRIEIMSDIQKVTDYYTNNGLEVNFNKTVATFFSNKHNYQPIESELFRYNIGIADEFVYLGVKIDRNLSMVGFGNDKADKIILSTRAMMTVRRYLPTSTLLNFYNAYISSHLMYCSFALSRLKTDQIKRLQTLQNRALFFS